MAKFLKTFRDAEQIWLGLEDEGMRRKVFRLINHDLVGSKHFTMGVTIFEPGERCQMHNHPGSEEIDYILKGRALAIDPEGNEKILEANDVMFIPEGEFHQHVSIGDEPLWLLWVYTPQGHLPPAKHSKD